MSRNARKRFKRCKKKKVNMKCLKKRRVSASNWRSTMSKVKTSSKS